MRISVLACVLVAVVFSVPASAQAVTGVFIGRLAMTPVEGSKEDFELIEDLEFREANGKRWIAPKGAIVDGASIPKWAQPFVGQPLSDNYKEASAIHDHFCNTMSRPWKEVHRVFFAAMLAKGVEPRKAAIMYLAVYHFGPRWTDDKEKFNVCSKKLARSRVVTLEDVAAMCANGGAAGEGRVTWTPDADEAGLKSLIEGVERGQSLESLERLADDRLSGAGRLAVKAREIGLLD